MYKGFETTVAVQVDDICKTEIDVAQRMSRSEAKNVLRSDREDCGIKAYYIFWWRYRMSCTAGDGTKDEAKVLGGASRVETILLGGPNC
jgi:hypothetical protein